MITPEDHSKLSSMLVFREPPLATESLVLSRVLVMVVFIFLIVPEDSLDHPRVTKDQKSSMMEMPTETESSDSTSKPTPMVLKNKMKHSMPKDSEIGPPVLTPSSILERLVMMVLMRSSTPSSTKASERIPHSPRKPRTNKATQLSELADPKDSDKPCNSSRVKVVKSTEEIGDLPMPRGRRT